MKEGVYDLFKLINKLYYTLKMFELGNLTIILPNYSCDRNCPFCIAKNNKKFNDDKLVGFDKLSDIFKQLRKNDIKFERIVLSGNGEPSLYNLEDLRKVAKIIRDNNDLFDILRIHTSGNIFWEKEKFDLFNTLVSNVEFDVLRIAINPEKDMHILEYKRNYIQTETFKEAKKIKFDIALTKELESNTFSEELSKLLHNNSNIGIIRFKDLMIGENEESQQSQWVKDNKMSKIQFSELVSSLLSYYNCKSINELSLKSGIKIVFENTGNYPKDVVYSRGIIMDYAEKPLDISKLQEMALKVDNTKTLSYYDFYK